VEINETAKPILLQLIVQPDQSSMAYQLPMIYQTLWKEWILEQGSTTCAYPRAKPALQGMAGRT